MSACLSVAVLQELNMRQALKVWGRSMLRGMANRQLDGVVLRRGLHTSGHTRDLLDEQQVPLASTLVLAAHCLSLSLSLSLSLCCSCRLCLSRSSVGWRLSDSGSTATRPGPRRRRQSLVGPRRRASPRPCCRAATRTGQPVAPRPSRSRRAGSRSATRTLPSASSSSRRPTTP
eukprot:SAG31_NODE_4198_length_3481_cov_21.063868_1_plen_174_part_00